MLRSLHTLYHFIRQVKIVPKIFCQNDLDQRHNKICIFHIEKKNIVETFLNCYTQPHTQHTIEMEVNRHTKLKIASTHNDNSYYSSKHILVKV